MSSTRSPTVDPAAGSDLSNRVAVVTGAGSGIGQHIASGMAARGADVVVVDIDEQAALQSARSISTTGARALAVQADLRGPEGVECMTRSALDRFGAVDILVNNVGGHVGGTEAPEDVSLSSWNQTFELNVTSALLCCQSLGKVMIERRYGKVINIASVYGLVAHDSSIYDLTAEGLRPEIIAYVTAKGALVSFTRGLATYWARHGITVNAIAPGMIRTTVNRERSNDHWRRLNARTPLGRPGHPNDLVAAAVFLASPGSDYVTGQTLAVDGGWTII